MTTDASVSENYQRLVSHTLSGVLVLQMKIKQ